MNRFCIILFLVFVSCNNQSKELPIHNYTKGSNGSMKYYNIGEFLFKDQLGNDFTPKNIQDKIYVANFFFTKCPSICPPMNDALKELAKTFINENEFIMVSHTIDPDNDTTEVLKLYAEGIEIASDKWFFVNGTKAATKTIATKYMTSFRKTIDGSDFYHSSIAILIDKNKDIRGFYNTLIPNEMQQLEEDIRFLKNKKADL